jgi:UDP-N-acetylglucosamine 2-epimerase (non-hydrolysing)
VAGTRPECIKMAPVYRELKRQDFAEIVLVGTGQHKELSASALQSLGVVLDADLGVGRPDQSLANLTARLFEALDRFLEQAGPDLVLVQGDTVSAMVGTVASFYRGIPVGHVEAGLRTGRLDQPFPEEFNRRTIAMVASMHFAPTERARANLIAERVDPEAIWLTGNTGIDGLLTAVAGAPPSDYPTVPGRPMALVTVHRRENFGPPLENICSAVLALRDKVQDLEFVFPVHPNPRVERTVHRHLGGQQRIHLIPPADYMQLLGLLKACHLVLTDSGGLQEEAPALGKPVFVLRPMTERPEGVEAGVARLVGTRPADIVAAIVGVLSDPQAYAQMATSVSPYGDGGASGRIAAACKAFLAPRDES